MNKYLSQFSKIKISQLQVLVVLLLINGVFVLPQAVGMESVNMQSVNGYFEEIKQVFAGVTDENKDEDKQEEHNVAGKTTSDFYRQFAGELKQAIRIREVMFAMPTWRDNHVESMDKRTQAAILSEGLGIIDDGQQIIENPGYASIVVTRADAISTLVKLKTQRAMVDFDKNLYVDNRLIFPDMRRDGRYVPYVLYAEEKGWLDGFVEKGEPLQPFAIVTYDEMVQLVEAFGGKQGEIDSKIGGEQFVRKGVFVDYLIEVFTEDYFSAGRMLWGNNIVLYKSLLASIEDKPVEEQRQILQSAYNKLMKQSGGTLLEEHNYDLWGIKQVVGQFVE